MEPQISMLLGFAIENFLKGVWVSMNASETKNVEKLPKAISGHNLVILAKEMAIDLDECEVELLRVLSEYTTWRGRYAISKAAHLNGEAFAKAKNLNLVGRQYPGDVDWPPCVHSVIGKIYDKWKNGSALVAP